MDSHLASLRGKQRGLTRRRILVGKERHDCLLEYPTPETQSLEELKDQRLCMNKQSVEVQGHPTEYARVV